MKTLPNIAKTVALIGASAALTASAQNNPWADSWLTQPSGAYAKIYTSNAALNSGTSATTWSRGQGVQSTPVYAGVQSVYLSEDWVYIETSGLGFHTMGPWYLNAAKTMDFPNFPGNTASLHRFPRNPTTPQQKTDTGLGVIGYFVDGVAMFDNRDAFSYVNASAQDAEPTNGLRGDGIWNRDAYINEGVTFDPAFAHQAGATYHYHANPPALRHRLGDHVDFDASTKSYSESAEAPEHSPILGWVNDGHPIYGPYGYSDPNDATSPVKRMLSGYIKRDGSHGSVNLNSTGRASLPAWAASVQNRSATLSTNQRGPEVSAAYILGHYLEDYAFLGDIGATQGEDFDLDKYNGRFCVTPEFPEGVYAYFVSIDADGTPAFPYNINRQYHGNPTGGAVTAVEEGAVLVFSGGPDRAIEASIQESDSNSEMVVISWAGSEGGSYVIERKSDLNSGNWAEVGSQDLTASNQGSIEDTGDSSGAAFYRIRLNGLAAYDDTEFGGGNGGNNNGGGGAGGAGVVSVTPSSGAKGSSVTLTIVMDANAQPPLPPQNAPTPAVRIGSSALTAVSRTGAATLQATWNIPSGMAPGAYNVEVEFAAPPGMTQTLVYALENGFTVE